MFEITFTEKTFTSADNGKHWTPAGTETKTVDETFSRNFTDPATIRFFNSWGNGADCRCSRAYTSHGYDVVRCTTVAPIVWATTADGKPEGKTAEALTAAGAKWIGKRTAFYVACA